MGTTEEGTLPEQHSQPLVTAPHHVLTSQGQWQACCERRQCPCRLCTCREAGRHHNCQSCCSCSDHPCRARLTGSLNVPDGGLAAILCRKGHSPGLQLHLQGSILPQLSHVHIQRLQCNTQATQHKSNKGGPTLGTGKHPWLSSQALWWAAGQWQQGFRASSRQADRHLRPSVTHQRKRQWRSA